MINGKASLIYVTLLLSPYLSLRILLSHDNPVPSLKDFHNWNHFTLQCFVPSLMKADRDKVDQKKPVSSVIYASVK
jgi:hypothetical protein